MSVTSASSIPPHPNKNLPFSQALYALKQGKKVKREIWGGYWYLANEAEVNHIRVGDNNDPIDGCKIDKLIIAVLRDNLGCAPAQPYQQDLLAEDWEILES